MRELLLQLSGVLSLIDPNVIDRHPTREDRRLVGVARPITAHGKVEQDEEGVVEDPARAGLVLGQATCRTPVHLPVDAMEVHSME